MATNNGGSNYTFGNNSYHSMQAQLSTAYTPTSSSNMPTSTTTTRTRGRQPRPNAKGDINKKASHEKKSGRQLPEKLFSFAPEGEIYRQLVHFERKLDNKLNAAHLDVQQAKMLSPPRVTRTLRVSLYNTFINQSAFYHTTAGDHGATTEPPSWTLHIDGQLLEQTDRYTGRNAQKKQFSKMLSSLVVQLDKNVYGDASVIEWTPSAQWNDSDGFEIKRQGEVEFTVKIYMHLENLLGRFKLSPALQRLLGIHTETRARVLTSLWQYIKASKLQEVEEDKRQVVCDAPLKEVFGCDRIDLANLPRLVSEHLSPPDPVQFDYTLKLSGNPQESKETYDIQIEMPEETPTFALSLQKQRELEYHEEQIQAYIQRIKNHAQRREFMLRFVTAPVQFLEELVASQIRDNHLHQINSTGTITGRNTKKNMTLDSIMQQQQSHAEWEDERHAAFYYGHHVSAALRQYLGEDS